MNENNILGVVLAGGKSKRFGQNKSEVKLGNKTLLEHTLNKIKSKFNKIIIVSNKDLVKNYTVIDDCIEGQLGPLVGVLSAMKWIKKNNKDYQWISSFPSDSPFFTKNELKVFYTNIDIQKKKLFFIKSKDTRHNIFGFWSLDLLDKLELDLQRGERKVEVWANTVDAQVIDIEHGKRDPFFNINTKEDLEKAYKIIENDKL